MYILTYKTVFTEFRSQHVLHSESSSFDHWMLISIMEGGLGLQYSLDTSPGTLKSHRLEKQSSHLSVLLLWFLHSWTSADLTFSDGRVCVYFTHLSLMHGT